MQSQPPAARPIHPDGLALATDLYQLTMGASYAALGMDRPAVFDLFVRRLPPSRRFLVVAGLAEALDRLASLRFEEDDLRYLRTLPIRAEFVDRLVAFRFTGDVRAVPEGRVVFPDEPILEVEAPLIEAQLAETFVVNAMHHATLVATKAARCVEAAGGALLFDFGLRRTPGIEAGLAVARAAYLAGFAGTSHVLAGARYGIPVMGTVAHSFVQACADEVAAFRAFAATFPGPATLLIDTYDTRQGARRAAAVARELAATGGRLAAVRIDSGDLLADSRAVRAILDEAGLTDVRIVASGGLDEYEIAALTRAGAPIDSYGVGTRLGTSADAPMLDMAYKLVAYDGTPRLKLSAGKVTLGGAKQVWRRRDAAGRFVEDRIAAADEPPPGDDFEPLLERVMANGEILVRPGLDEIRARHRAEIAALPERLRALDDADVRYPVSLSPRLAERQRAAVAAVRRREGLDPSGPDPSSGRRA
ncbi:MAG TPA: nicotinate phosphoribosyltransferase [Thermodesulfobacteriota bacterium]